LGHALLTLKLKLEALAEQLQPQQVSVKIEISKILRFISETIGEVRRLYPSLYTDTAAWIPPDGNKKSDVQITDKNQKQEVSL